METSRIHLVAAECQALRRPHDGSARLPLERGCQLRQGFARDPKDPKDPSSMNMLSILRIVRMLWKIYSLFGHLDPYVSWTDSLNAFSKDTCA